MNSDWPQIKARLARYVSEIEFPEKHLPYPHPKEVKYAADIRAALQRVNDLENACMVHHDEYAKLRQRVEELERGKDRIQSEILSLCDSVSDVVYGGERGWEKDGYGPAKLRKDFYAWNKRRRERAEAAERRVEELEEMGRAWRESDEHKNANALRQRVEELEREAEDAALTAAQHYKRAEAAEAKLARCVEALREIKGRVLASQTHEIGPLEAKERLAAVLVSARAALAAAKGE